MRKFRLSTIVILIGVSCAPLGTSTYSYQPKRIKPENIGYYTFKLNYVEQAIEQKSDSIFREAINKEVYSITEINPEFHGYLNSEDDVELVKSKDHNQS